MKAPFKLAFLCLIAALVVTAENNLKLASIFTDHAVFQRNIPIPVWGTTNPHQLIKAELNGITAFTRSSKTGDFILRLPAMQAGGPYTLTILNTQTQEKLLLQDILVGEVWIASGQSNMQYALGSNWIPTKAQMTPEQLKNSINSKQLKEFQETFTNTHLLRAIEVPRFATCTVEKSFNGEWKLMTPENAFRITAVGLWFGRNLLEDLKVPVGIIYTSWGGSAIEAWTSRSGLLSNPDTAERMRQFDQARSQEKFWNGKYISAQMFYPTYGKKDPGNQGFAKGYANEDFNDAAWKPLTVPGSWIEQKIAGNGAVWARYEVTLPAQWAGKELKLSLGGVDKQDTTYFNGVQIGATGKNFEAEYWEVRRQYKVPGNLVKAGRNVIAVRAYSFLQDGAFTGDKELYLLSQEGQTPIRIDGAWKALAEIDYGKLPFKRIESHSKAPSSSPAVLYDAMIEPLIPYGIRGAIWYQGESNAGGKVNSLQYRNKMTTMIKDWRYNWGQGDFPFIQVQLASFRAPFVYNDEEAWPYLRESQFKACQDMKDVYMAISIDVGDAKDIHPQDKKTVGRRLALIALNKIYGKSDVIPMGPMFKSAIPEGNAIRVTFDYAEGLAFKGEPKGFYLADASKKFQPATSVTIDGNTLVLKCDKIAKPIAVRYNWANNPSGNHLYNNVNLPASPFRSDTW